MAEPMMRRTFLSIALASAGGLALSGCNVFDDGGSAKAAGGGGGQPGRGATATLRQLMAPVPHLDPAMTGSMSAAGNLLQTGVMEGLVLRNPDDAATVLPGVAEAWDVSPNGTVYTFHLRNNAKWSNGDPVTAHDFVWNWQRLLSPETTANVEYKSSSGPDVLAVVGAAEFVSGTQKDFSKVGVKALDESTVEFTLNAASPLFFHLLAEWRTLPLNPKMVEAHPKDWLTPENFVGNGPYVLSRWKANGGATFTKNPKYWDTASYSVATWEVTFNDGGDTAAIVKYSNKETDLFRLEGDPGAVLSDSSMADQLVTGPPSQFKCLLALTSHNPLLEDIRIRKALSLAIDRDAIAKVAAPDEAAWSLVPSGLPGHEEVKQTKLDVAAARALLAEAGHPDGKGMPVINLLVAQQTPWLEAVGGMWQKNLGVRAKVDVIEQGVFSQRRTAVQAANYVGFCFGYFGLTPPTLYKSVQWTPGNLASFMLPGDAAAEFQALAADAKMAPADKAAKQEEIIQTKSFPEYRRFLELRKQVMASVGDADKLHAACVAALNAREDTYVALPVLSAGYSFLVSPSVRDLKVTSFPDRVFPLKGVTVSS